MRINGASRSVANLALALRLAEAVAARRHTCPSPKAPTRARPDYAQFVAKVAAERAPERVAYADLAEARRAARRTALRMAERDTTPDATRARRVNAETPSQPLPAAPAQRESVRDAAARVAFRRAVETVNNRGSLIDLLL